MEVLHQAIDVQTALALGVGACMAIHAPINLWIMYRWLDEMEVFLPSCHYLAYGAGNGKGLPQRVLRLGMLSAVFIFPALHVSRNLVTRKELERFPLRFRFWLRYSFLGNVLILVGMAVVDLLEPGGLLSLVLE